MGIPSSLFLLGKLENSPVPTGLTSALADFQPCVKVTDSRLILAGLLTSSKLSTGSCCSPLWVPVGKTRCLADAGVPLSSKETPPACCCRVFSKGNNMICNCQSPLDCLQVENTCLGGGTPGHLPPEQALNPDSISSCLLLPCLSRLMYALALARHSSLLLAASKRHTSLVGFVMLVV